MTTATQCPIVEVMSNQPTYTLIRQYGVDRTVRTMTFSDFDSALAEAKATTPDTDGMLVPNVDDEYAYSPNYWDGVSWYGNLYAVILHLGFAEEAARWGL